MTGWASAYVGIPYVPGGRTREGLDCWGLLRLVYAEELGVALPSYRDAPDPAERAELAGLIQADREAGPWQRVEDIRPFDGLLFRVGAHAVHMAVAVNDTRMLHVSHGGRAVVQRIEDPMWRSRLVGIYRWQGEVQRTVRVTELRGMLDQRRCFDVVPSLTLDQIVRQALPGATEAVLDRVRISMRKGGVWRVVPRGWWPRIRPHAGAEVMVRLVPGDPSILALKIAMYLSANTAFGTVAINAIAIGGALAVTALGAAALTSLIPTPDVPDRPGDPEKGYSLQGWQNEAIPGEPVQDVAGELRVAPVYLVAPYQEIVGDKQYLRALFCFGYGPLEISDLRIGETSVEDYEEVQVELRQGLPEDDPVTFTPMQVIEDTEQVETTFARPLDENGNPFGVRVESPIVRTTAANTVRINLVFYLPGLFYVDSDGDLDSNYVEFRIEQRPRGSETWSTVEAVFRTEETKNGPFFRSYGWTPPARGTWEVRVTRLSPSDAGSRNNATCYLSAVQSFRPEYPINLEAMPAPLALCSIRVRATHNLSGTLNSLNALVKRRAPAWTGSEWVSGATRNPASAYLWALQGPANPNPVPDAQIDWVGLREWFTFCEETGLTYDREHRAFEGLIDRLKAIARAGRASPWHDGVRWSVTIDRTPEAIVDQITPRNSRNFAGSRTYPKPPHAVRVRFRDRTNDYADAEVTVRWPGHTGPITLVEQWDATGKTDPEEIQREIYRQMLTVIHRRDRWTVEQDGAIRHATRGDWVWLSHYNLARFQSAGRVVSVTGDLVVLDEVVEMEAGLDYGIRFLRFDEDDTIGDSELAQVRTVVGPTRALRIASGEMPAVGDLVTFGPLAEVGEQALVLDVEPGEEFSYTLTLTNAAPQIDTLTAAFEPEDWDSVVGQVIDLGIDPLAPSFRGVKTTVAEGLYGDDARTLSVTLGPASADTALIAGMQLEHRLTGAGSWTAVSAATTAKTFALTYDLDDAVELRGRALDFDGDYGPWTEVTTFIVGSDMAPVPEAIDLDAISATGALGRATLLLAHGDPDTVSIEIFRTPAGDPLDTENDAIGAPVPVTSGASVSYVDGDASRTDRITDGGFDDAGAWTAGGGWVVSAGTATHAPGSASVLSQALVTSTGVTYRGQLTLSGRSAGSVTLRLAGGTAVATAAISDNGQTLFSLTTVTSTTDIEIEASSDFDGAIESVTLIRQTAACAPAGAFDYRFAALNGDGVASAVSAPLTITII